MLCSTENASPVTDVEECFVAFASLKDHYRSSREKPDVRSGTPKGCFVKQLTDDTFEYLYLQLAIDGTHETDLHELSWNFHQICKRK